MPPPLEVSPLRKRSIPGDAGRVRLDAGSSVSWLELLAQLVVSAQYELRRVREDPGGLLRATASALYCFGGRRRFPVRAGGH